MISSRNARLAPTMIMLVRTFAVILLTAFCVGCMTSPRKTFERTQIAKADLWLGRTKTDLLGALAAPFSESLPNGGEKFAWHSIGTDAIGGMHSITYYTDATGRIVQWVVEGPGYMKSKALSVR